MIGNLLTRGLVMILGYAYPAYECFKTVERNKPEIEQLRFWCQYWILVALMTVFERVGDTFVSWVPMYCEAKLAFIIYLWYPKTKGTTYVYESFFRPYIAKHESDIDRNIMELRTRAGDMVFMYFQKVAIYGQTRIFEILQFVAAQSTPRPRASQPPQQPAPRPRQPPAVATRQPPAKPQPQNEEPPSPTSSTSSTQQEKEADRDEASSSSKSSSSAPPPPPAGPTQTSTVSLKKAASIPGSPAHASSPLKKSTSLPAAPSPPRPRAALPAPEGSTSSQSTAGESEQAQKTEVVPASPRRPAARSLRAPPQETVMEETIRVTRGRLRNTRSSATAATK